MFKRKMLHVLAVSLAVVGLSACAEKVQWNQKITINVETPDGLKSGSSVTRMLVGESAVFFGINALTPPEARGVGSSVKGEAIVVDMGEGQFLFGLLSGIGMTQCAIDWGDAKWFPDGARYVSRFDGVATLEGRCQPRLVTFYDINDPASVKRVDPNDLDASFGLCSDGSGLTDADAPWRAEDMTWRWWTSWQASGLPKEEFEQEYSGRLTSSERAFLEAQPARRDTSGDCYRIADITLEVTDDAVTERVADLLGWYSGYPEPGLCRSTGRIEDIPFCRRVNHGDFIRQ